MRLRPYLFAAIGAFIIGRIARTVLSLRIPDYKEQLPLVLLLNRGVGVDQSCTAIPTQVERSSGATSTTPSPLVFLTLGTLVFDFFIHTAVAGALFF